MATSYNHGGSASIEAGEEEGGKRRGLILARLEVIKGGFKKKDCRKDELGLMVDNFGHSLVVPDLNDYWPFQ